MNLMRIIGYLGADPVVKEFEDGNRVVKLSLATNSSWLNKRTGVLNEDTEWHTVYFRGRVGAVAEEYLKKGHRVYLEGKKRTRSYVNDKQETHWVTEIVGKKLILFPGQLDNHTPSKQTIAADNTAVAAAAQSQSSMDTASAEAKDQQTIPSDQVVEQNPVNAETAVADSGMETGDSIHKNNQVESHAATNEADLVDNTNHVDDDEDLDLEIQEDFSDEFNRKAKVAEEEDESLAHGGLPDWLIP